MSWSCGNLEESTLRLANQEKSLHSDSHLHYLINTFLLVSKKKKKINIVVLIKLQSCILGPMSLLLDSLHYLISVLKISWFFRSNVQSFYVLASKKFHLCWSYSMLEYVLVLWQSWRSNNASGKSREVITFWFQSALFDKYFSLSRQKKNQSCFAYQGAELRLGAKVTTSWFPALFNQRA